MRTLSPDTKITIKTACSVIGAGILGISALASWLNAKFDEQQRSIQNISTNLSELRWTVSQQWSVQHMQVWTDMYNTRRDGSVPNPNDVINSVGFTRQ